MITQKEQTIIEKIKKQRKINEQLRDNPPHEQDNIPNLFSCLTDEEFDYFMKNRHLLELLEQTG